MMRDGVHLKCTFERATNYSFVRCDCVFYYPDDYQCKGQRATITKHNKTVFQVQSFDGINKTNVTHSVSCYFAMVVLLYVFFLLLGYSRTSN